MNLSTFFYRVTHWQTWPPFTKYIPLTPAWCWYCLRAGSFWFFTPSNPTISFGGFEGESKREMYEQLPPGSFPHSIYINPSMKLEEVEAMMKENGLDYPFAVKPDIGMSGYMFRIIRNRQTLANYHTVMPFDYIIQQLIEYPVEVSVFYYRFPGHRSGTITGFLRKEFLEVTGNGRSTLWQLIQEYPGARFRLEEFRLKHAAKLENIIPAGEHFRLSSALNLSAGCKMIDLSHEKDAKMLKMFDGLNLYSKQFYYGRYDIKCTSIEDLRNAKNYSIMEYNGCGAEPHHIYARKYSLLQAYREVIHHWNVLYRISSYNHKKGIRYWDTARGLRFLREAKKHFKVLKKLDAEFEI